MPPSPSTEDPLDKLDQLVDAAPEPENAVLTDNAPVVRWTGPLFALLAVILLPWTLCLGITLPSRLESSHYDVAWVGFDLFLLALLAGLCLWLSYHTHQIAERRILLLRRRPRRGRRR